MADWFEPYLTQLDRDFIEHNPKENVFSVDISLDNVFDFVVHYVYPSSKKIDKLVKKSIGLKEIKFDDTSCQVYYYDTPLFRQKIEESNKQRLATDKAKKQKQDEINAKNIEQLRLADKFVKNIEYISFSEWKNENDFILNLEKEYKNFLPKIKEYFFTKIENICKNSTRYYNKPFLNYLIWNRHGYIVEFLLKNSLPRQLYVDGVDESNLAIWDQLIGMPYGFANTGYIDEEVLVPLINKHTKKKNYTIEEL